MTQLIRGRKLLLTLMILGVALAVPAVAQSTGDGSDRTQGIRSERQLDFMIERLELSDEQANEVRGILAEHRAEAAEWFSQNASATREERMAFHAEHRADLHTSLAEVLTDEQEQKLDKVLSTRRGARGAIGQRDRGMQRGDRAMRGARGDGRMAQRVWNQLDLTEDQIEKLQAMRDAHRQERTAWIEKNPNATRQDRMEFMEQHREAGRAELETVLTPEQLEKLNSLRENRPKRGPRQGRSRM